MSNNDANALLVALAERKVHRGATEEWVAAVAGGQHDAHDLAILEHDASDALVLSWLDRGGL